MKNNASYNTVKTPIGELCKQALEHYLELSDKACHYNSLIPEAIELYRKTHIEKCDNCKWNKPPDDCKLGREPETNMPICSSFNSVYDLSEQTRKHRVTCTSPHESDKTCEYKPNEECTLIGECNWKKIIEIDVVKSSQLGFEVPEDEAEV